MSNADEIIAEIYLFLDKFALKTNTLTKEDFLQFVEKRWYEAGDDKYNNHSSYIIAGRMTNEYIWVKDFDNMMRWLENSHRHAASQRNEEYIRNYYKGQCCLECGNEEKALEYLHLCYAVEPDYIFTRAPFCYEFFNKHLEHPRDLTREEDDEEDDDFYNIIDLPYWKTFFNEKKSELGFEILLNDFEYADKPDEEHKAGLQYVEDNQEAILKAILTALLEKYPALQKRYDYPANEKADFMPDVTTIEGFANLLTPTIFYVTSVYKDGIPYIGFSFSCSWDSEHALGVMTHKDRVVALEGADMAFNISTAERDLEETKTS